MRQDEQNSLRNEIEINLSLNTNNHYTHWVSIKKPSKNSINKSFFSRETISKQYSFPMKRNTDRIHLHLFQVFPLPRQRFPLSMGIGWCRHFEKSRNWRQRDPITRSWILARR